MKSKEVSNSYTLDFKRLTLDSGMTVSLRLKTLLSKSDKASMTPEDDQREDKDNSKLLALLLLIGAGVLAFLYLSSDNTKKKIAQISAAVRSEKFEKSVNKHLMVTNETMALERQRMEVENARLASDFSSTKPQPTYTAPSGGVDLSQDNRASDIANELGRGERKEDSFLNPADAVQKDLFNQQQSEEYSQAYKEEYARQFVENARRGGYKVILDSDYKVISVQPIRNPSANLDTGEPNGLQ